VLILNYLNPVGLSILKVGNEMKTNIFSNVLERVTTPRDERIALDRVLLEIESKIKPQLKKFSAKLFVGGSLAKQTLVKRESGYDIDIFIMFSYAKYKARSHEISEILEKILKASQLKYTVLKGSRNYFQVTFKNLTLELIPILEIKKASEALNITDISPLHVSYILAQIKRNKKLADDIKLAKAFCYANDCYGAESYIRGFSGYSLEVLVSYYNSFMNFVKAAVRWKMPTKFEDRIIVDPKNYYKNKSKLLEDMNEAKLHSPIILVDPVQKERNACAALSFETLKRFTEACKKFIKNPSENFFFKEKLDIEKLKNQAKKAGAQFVMLRATTFKDKVDVAGAKLKKIYELLFFSLKKNGFKVLRGEFDFNEQTLEAKFYLIIKEPEKRYIVNGPPLNVDKKYIEAFKKKWPKSFVKNKRLYAKANREISNISRLLKAVPKEQLKEMGIKSILI
jgi:tRNA nucleotidyltransferase (CCA-adding enzyme)